MEIFSIMSARSLYLEKVGILTDILLTPPLSQSEKDFHLMKGSARSHLFFFSIEHNKSYMVAELVFPRYCTTGLCVVEPYSKCPYSNHQSQQRIQILGYHISVDIKKKLIQVDKKKYKRIFQLKRKRNEKKNRKRKRKPPHNISVLLKIVCCWKGVFCMVLRGTVQEQSLGGCLKFWHPVLSSKLYNFAHSTQSLYTAVIQSYFSRTTFLT